MKLDEEKLLNTIKDFYKTKSYEQGYKIIIENEDVITKKYYEITKYKLLFLISLNKLIEASMLIKDELSVPYVPSDFEEFLLEKNKEVTFLLKEHSNKSYSSDDIEEIDKLDNDSLLSVLPSLKKYNLNGYHRQFQNILLNTTITDLTKSLLIACLSDVKLNETFYVIKESITIKFNPSNVFDIRDGDNYVYINKQIKELNNIEINTLEIIKRLTTTYLLNIYPLIISEDECDYLIGASIVLAGKMMNSPLKNEKYQQIIEKHYSKVQKMQEKLNILLETI